MNLGEITTTIVGNLVAAPELRFTGDGKPVANFTVAVNHRKFRNGEWTDDGSSFFRCTAWQNLATNIVESFPEKGMPIMVYGTVRMNRWEGEDGVKRDQAEMNVVAAGPNLMFSVASVSRPNRWGDTTRATEAFNEDGSVKENDKTSDDKSSDASSENAPETPEAEETTSNTTTASKPRKRSTRKTAESKTE